MLPPRNGSTTAVDKRMIDAWVARHLPLADADIDRAERLTAARLMIRLAMQREMLAPGVLLLEG